METIRKHIEGYLHEARLMQVATARDNQPWACSVYFAYDDKLNLYWISKQTRRHSQEILKNNKVAGTIVLSHTPGDKVHGLQFQGTAQELNEKKDAETAMKYYGSRYGMPQERITAIIENTDGHVCYRITPSLIVLFDEIHFPDKPRQEYTLN